LPIYGIIKADLGYVGSLDKLIKSG